MKYSQNDEELFILEYFSNKPTGKFIDIGAYHIERFSNTRALYLQGWGGIFVEPSPENYNAIYEHYKNDPKITTLNVAIGEHNAEIDFYASDDAVSTSDEEHMKKWGSAGVKFAKIRVPQLGVVDFMKQYCHDIDFLSIDTEATNIIVFRHIPDFVWEQICMLCIEHDGHFEEIEKKLEGFGFTKLYFNGENILLAKL